VLITWISTIVALSVLIFVHELGHFLAAKGVGIQVPRFSLGFGRKLAGFRWGETEFVVSAIPLGGYVKMAGMEDDEGGAEVLEGGPADDPIDPERTFDRKPLWARTLVISAGVVMNLLFAWLVFSVTALFYGEKDVTETRVSVTPQFPAKAAPQLAGIPEGARLVSVAGRPVHRWDDVREALDRAPAGPVELRFANAPPVTLNLPKPDEERAKALAGFGVYVAPVIGRVEGGSRASRAGLQVGDRVLTADGAPVRSWQELVNAIRGHPAKPLALTVDRAGRHVAVTVTPESVKDQDPEGNAATIGRIGAGPEEPVGVDRPVGPVRAVVKGAQATWMTAQLIADILKRLMTGQLSARNMGGIISIGQASGETAQLGFDYWLSFLAGFSVNLAILNLLPIPILDGGHLMFLLFEAVRGRPLSVEARIRLSQVGLVIVVALMIWANGNDVVRLVFGR
jgi:regulator of sigma E protease